MYTRSVLTLIILRDIYTKSVYFVLAYIQDVAKSELYMEITI